MPKVKIHSPKVGKEDQQYVEVEVSEDETVSVEVDVSSEEEKPLPKATLPKGNLDVVQGSVDG